MSIQTSSTATQSGSNFNGTMFGYYNSTPATVFKVFEPELNVEVCRISYIVHSPLTSSYQASNAGLCILNFILAVMGCVLHSLILFTFWLRPTMRSRMCYFTTMVFSTVGFGVVFLSHPLYVFQLVSEMSEVQKCLYKEAYFFVFCLFTGMYGWTLFLINIERYISLVHPVVYILFVHKRRFLFCCLVFWIFNLSCVVSIFYSSFLSSVYEASFYTISGTSAVVYLLIVFVERRKLCRVTPGCQQARANIPNFLRQLKIAKCYLLASGITFICNVPLFYVVHMYEPWQNSETPKDNVAYAFGWSSTLSSLSATLNSLVFLRGCKKLRKESWKIVSKWLSKRRVNNEGSTVRIFDETSTG